MTGVQTCALPICLSVGIENIDDILDDLKGAFEAVRVSGLAE